MPNCPAGGIPARYFNIPNRGLPNLIPQYPVSPASRAREASVMAAEAAVTAERIWQKIRIWFCLFWIGLMYWIGHTQNESDKSHESDPDTLILAICENRALSLNRAVSLILAIGQKFQTWLSYFSFESGLFARIGHNFWIWLEQTCYIFPVRSGRRCQVQRNNFVRFDAEVRFRKPAKLSGVRFKYKIDNIRLGAHPGEPDNRTIGRPIVRFTNERPVFYYWELIFSY